MWNEIFELIEYYRNTWSSAKSVNEAAMDYMNVAIYGAEIQGEIKPRIGSSLPKQRQLELPAAKEGRGHFFWGGEWKSIDTLQEHSMLFGATGSGKSLLMHIAMKGILEAITPGSDTRAIIFDTKGEVKGILEGMNIPYQYINISDVRATACDFERDIGGDYSRAEDFSYTFFPPEGKGGDQFFNEASRGAFYAIHRSFIYEGKHYDLSDLVNAARLPLAELIKIAELCPSNQGIVNRYLKCESAETLAGILSSLERQLLKIEFAAAHSQRSKEKISLRDDFLNKETVLVVSIDLEAPELAKAYMQAIFCFLSKQIQASSDSKTRRTFIILDEMRLIGRMRGIREFLTFCRSKGARVLGATQSRSGLDEEYGKEQAEELLENFTIGFLKTKGGETAKYGSSLYGSVRVRRETSGGSQAQAGAGTSDSLQDSIENRVLDSEFSNIPDTNPQNGLTGIFPTEKGVVKRTMSWRLIMKLLPPSVDVEAILRREGKEQLLLPWTEEQKRSYMQKGGNRDAKEIKRKDDVVDEMIDTALYGFAEKLVEGFMSHGEDSN